MRIYIQGGTGLERGGLRQRHAVEMAVVAAGTAKAGMARGIVAAAAGDIKTQIILLAELDYK